MGAGVNRSGAMLRRQLVRFAGRASWNDPGWFMLAKTIEMRKAYLHLFEQTGTRFKCPPVSVPRSLRPVFGRWV